jgi:hypothetical protein
MGEMTIPSQVVLASEDVLHASGVALLQRALVITMRVYKMYGLDPSLHLEDTQPASADTSQPISLIRECKIIDFCFCGPSFHRKDIDGLGGAGSTSILSWGSSGRKSIWIG